MPLIKAYNIDSDLHGLKSHSIFKSVYTVEASWKGTFGHLMQTASAESRFSLEDLRRRSINPTIVDDVLISNVDSSNLMFKGFRYEIFYLDDFSSNEAKLTTCLFSKASLGWLWHRRLGQVGMSQLNQLTKHDLVRGLNDVKFEKNKLCSSCPAEKQVENTHPNKSQMSIHRPLELFHMGLFGPTSFVSIGGNSYYLVIVDDYSRFTWVYFLRDKSNVFETFKSFAILAQNQFEFYIKKVRSDNGSELKNARIDAYTPKQNGIVEMKNRTLIDMARSMLVEYNVSDSYWAEDINIACHASNRLYCHKLLKKTQYELLIGRKQNISYLEYSVANAIF
jgi:hypothetical protein